MIEIESKGSFKNTENFLKKVSGNSIYSQLERYAQMGKVALSEATPKETGKTSDSWSYEISSNNQSTLITWSNDDITSDGTPIVILLQYGHGTGTGGYIQGTDFINPTIKPIFNEIADNVWKAVKSA